MNNDEQFNTLKFSLPIYLRIDRNLFFLKLEEIYTLELSEIQKVDLFYTLYSFNIKELWIKCILTIFDSLTIKYQKELLKFSSFSINDDDFETFKQLYSKLLLSITNEDELFDLCFSKTDFFKPLMHSKLKSMNMMNRKTLNYLVENIFNRLTSDDKKLECLEKTVFLRDLSTNELDLMILFVKENKYSGRAIDILLRSENVEYTQKALDIIHNDNSLSSDNTVHFFDIPIDLVNEINSKTKNKCNILSDIHEIINLGSTLTTSKNELDILYHVSNMVLTSGFVYQKNFVCLRIEDCVSYCWSECCTLEEEKSMIKELLSFANQNTCSYGLIINILCFLIGLGKEIHLELSDYYQKKDDALTKLQKKYPIDDTFWLDSEQIENEIKLLMKSENI
uniref:Uncharacterized protein n=1 Tax=viral metagenome TaxID=1070528 RepID=A0A6C0JVR6_9ZZZZ